MEFLVNDLSVHGQFQDLGSFQDSVARVMAVRQRIHQFGYALHCHRNLLGRRVTATARMQQAVAVMPKPKQRAWMQWITRQGPFWEDARTHSENDYLEVDDKLVTESAIGEAAVCVSRGVPRHLVSFEPSDWLRDPVAVRWVRDENTTEIQVPNHWSLPSVQQALNDNPRPVASWSEVAQRAVERCDKLTISNNAFDALRGHPFVPGAADRITVLLNTLNQFKGCFDDDGSRSAEGHRIYQDQFTGKKGKKGKGALFKDSSDSEKRDFKGRLTFPHPDKKGETLFCPWHGAVQTPQLRIHFSWPVTADTPLYVVYVGPKITKR